jgi:hypothetical protein
VRPVNLCWVAAPSAGGPGKGLDTEIPGLLDKIGIPVPDGDTDKLGKAAAAWSAFAGDQDVGGLSAALGAISSSFVDTLSPEIQDIQDHLRTMQGSAGQIVDSAGDLAKQVQGHADTLHDLRNDIGDLITALALQLATTAVIAIAFTFLSAGLSDEAGTVAGAAEIAETGSGIRSAITGSRLFQVLAKLFDKAGELEKAGQDLDEIDSLDAEDIDEAESQPDEEPATESDPEFDYNTRPERLRHTFADKHKLGDFVTREGGQPQAMRAMLDSVRAQHLPPGVFQTVINSGGEDITVRGFIDGTGQIKVSTAYIP